MKERRSAIRALGWTGRSIGREPTVLLLVLLIIVVFGVVNVLHYGEHPRTGANAIGGPISGASR